MLVQEIFSVVTFGVVVGLAFLSNYFLHRLDVTPLTVAQEENNAGQFIAERAYLNLKTLNDFGPKVIGSDNNEKVALNFILDRLNFIRNASVRSGDIEVDHQIISGQIESRQTYRNLQNIVVRVQGRTNHSLMLNCHFDSVPGSPGASDDIVMCCVMIEIYRVLSLEGERQRHSIIFLFNGAEEEDLQASHGFVTQHRWREEVKAYINLESTGSGGREILFRSGPKHDWLIRMYRESAPRPFGHSVAEELFETGVIPSATDFEIFRDYGNYSGIDFAYVEEGWRYHTRYDSIDYITHESVQYTGDNILALVRKMANADELENPPEGSFAVYWDYLGLFMVSYTHGVGIALNITISILAVALPFVVQTKFKLTNIGFVATETIISFLTILLSTILSASICYLIAIIMNAADNTMSWFNTIFLSIGIYGALAVVVQIATYQLVQFLCEKFVHKWQESGKVAISRRHRLKVQLNGVNLFWAIITIMITAMGYRFGYITMNLLFVTLCTNIVTFTICKFTPKLASQSWICMHLFGQSLIFLFLCYMMIQVWELFLPIAGKQYYSNPDTMIGMILTLWTVLCLSYLIPLTTLVKYRAILYSTLLTIFLVSFILAFTPVGQPYSDARSAPRLQRFRIIHTQRNFYDADGALRFNDNGYLISTLDRNADRTVDSSLESERLIKWDEDDMCKTEAFCGFPFYRFRRGRYMKGFQIPPTLTPTKFSIVNSARNPQNASQLLVQYTLDYTSLTMIIITPGNGWRYVDGSLKASTTRWNDAEVYESKITFGVRTGEIMEEYFILEDTTGADMQTAAKVNVATVESVFEKNPEYVELMEKLPEWIFAFQQQADVSIYNVKGL